MAKQSNKKPTAKSKLSLSQRWLPKTKKARILFTSVFVALAALLGTVIYRQSFAYIPSFVYFSQHDSAWANSPYPYIAGTRDQSDLAITRSGCGPTSIAMVATNLRRTVSPKDVAAWYGTRFHTSAGTDPSIYPVFARDYSLQYAYLGSFNSSSTQAAMQSRLQQSGTLLIVHVGPGYFTRSGHIMVIRAYSPSRDKGSYLIADPNNSNNNRWFTTGELTSSGNLRAVYSFAR